MSQSDSTHDGALFASEIEALNAAWENKELTQADSPTELDNHVVITFEGPKDVVRKYHNDDVVETNVLGLGVSDDKMSHAKIDMVIPKEEENQTPKSVMRRYPITRLGPNQTRLN